MARARHTGDTARNERAALNTMKRLELCPATRDAVTSGQVSLQQASEIVLTEEAVPGSETDLLPLAKRSGLSKVRDRARNTRANAIPADELHTHQRAARSVRHWRDELGMIAGTFRLTPETGVPFVNRLEREAQRLRQRGEAARRDGRAVRGLRGRRVHRDDPAHCHVNADEAP